MLPRNYRGIVESCRRRQTRRTTTQHVFALRDPSRDDLESFLSYAEKAFDEKWPCAICGKLPTDDKPHYPKHKLPPSFGGDDRHDNLMILCASCQVMALKEDDHLKELYRAERVRRLAAGDASLPEIPMRSYVED